MTPEQVRIVKRLWRLVNDAREAGLVSFVDVEGWGIRLVSKAEIDADFNCDPRSMGEVVQLDSACGTASGPRNGISVM